MRAERVAYKPPRRKNYVSEEDAKLRKATADKFRRRPHITMRHHSLSDFADDTLQEKCGTAFLLVFGQCIYVTLGSDELQTEVQPYDSTFVFCLKLVAKNVKIVRLGISYKRMESVLI